MYTSNDRIGVGCIAQTVPQKVESQHGHDDKDDRRHDPCMCAQGLQILRVAHEKAPADQRFLNADAQKAEKCFRQNNLGNGQGQHDDDVADRVGEEVQEYDARVGRAHLLGRENEVGFSKGQHFPPHFACQQRPRKQRKDDHHDDEHLQRVPRARDDGGQRQPEWKLWKGGHKFDEALDDIVGHAAIVTRYNADDRSDHDADQRGEQAERKGDAPGCASSAPQISALFLRAQQVDLAPLADAEQMPESSIPSAWGSAITQTFNLPFPAHKWWMACRNSRFPAT